MADVGQGLFDVRKTSEMSRAAESGPVECFAIKSKACCCPPPNL